MKLSREAFGDIGWIVAEKYERLNKFYEYGLCGKCRELKYRGTKLMDSIVWCDAYYNVKNHNRSSKIIPNNRDPITECSDFYPRGQLSLSDMGKIAVIIDITDKKVGFQSNGEKEVTISYPEPNED
jgi:hypothetical protein